MKITKGTKLKANGLIMVVTGENEKSFLGYLEYKGRPVGQTSMLKEHVNNKNLSEVVVLDEA